MIERLTLTNFRNHESLRIDTGGAQFVALCGANGTGKTNVLESLSLLGAGSGLRRAEVSDLTTFRAIGGFGIAAELIDGTRIGAGLSDAGRKSFAIDGASAPAAAIAACARFIWITPTEDRIFTISPTERRAFFDHLCATFDPAHNGRLARLSKILSERAAALKCGADDAWLTGIELSLCETSSAVAAARCEFIRQLNGELIDAPLGIRAAVAFDGWWENRIAGGAPTSATESAYCEYLADNRIIMNDRQIIEGAHKTDFSVMDLGREIPAHLCSTGQQKMILLGIILAHARLIKKVCGRAPIILLDEVVAHLDSARRAELFAGLDASDAQVFMTGVDSELFAGLARVKVIEL